MSWNRFEPEEVSPGLDDGEAGEVLEPWRTRARGGGGGVPWALQDPGGDVILW